MSDPFCRQQPPPPPITQQQQPNLANSTTETNTIQQGYATDNNTNDNINNNSNNNNINTKLDNVDSLTQKLEGLTTQGKDPDEPILDGPTPHKLFVGQIPPFTSEATLRAHFEPFGRITHLVILKDRFTGAHKGCGFVCYANRNESDAAIVALADKVRLPNAKREMIVRYAGEKPDEPEYKLYVCMLSRSSTENDIRAMFSKYGPLGEVFIIRSREGGASKGAAFVKFLNKQDAEAAIDGLHEKIRDKDAPGLVQVRFAHTKDERAAHLSHVLGHQNANLQLIRGQQLMYAHPQMPYTPYVNAPYVGRTNYQSQSNQPNSFGGPQSQHFGRHSGTNDAYQSNSFNNANANQYTGGYDQNQGYTSRSSGSSGRASEVRGPYGANLFVYNLPELYGEAELGTLFGNFGNVLSTRIQRDPYTNNSRGFGFVSFDSAASAQQAIDALDGFSIGNKKLSVRLKAGSQVSGSRNPNFNHHLSFPGQSHTNFVQHQQSHQHPSMSPNFYDDCNQPAQF